MYGLTATMTLTAPGITATGLCRPMRERTGWRHDITGDASTPDTGGARAAWTETTAAAGGTTNGANTSLASTNGASTSGVNTITTLTRGPLRARFSALN